MAEEKRRSLREWLTNHPVLSLVSFAAAIVTITQYWQSLEPRIDVRSARDEVERLLLGPGMTFSNSLNHPDGWEGVQTTQFVLLKSDGDCDLSYRFDMALRRTTPPQSTGYLSMEVSVPLGRMDPSTVTTIHNPAPGPGFPDQFGISFFTRDGGFEVTQHLLRADFKSTEPVLPRSQQAAFFARDRQYADRLIAPLKRLIAGCA